jgi:hypothetical protein
MVVCLGHRLSRAADVKEDKMIEAVSSEAPLSLLSAGRVIYLRKIFVKLLFS